MRLYFVGVEEGDELEITDELLPHLREAGAVLYVGPPTGVGSCLGEQDALTLADELCRWATLREVVRSPAGAAIVEKVRADLEQVLRCAAYALTRSDALLFDSIPLEQVARRVAGVEAPAWLARRDAWLAVYGQLRGAL